MDSFTKLIDNDEHFFIECCDYGLKLAIDQYKDQLPHIYNSEFHEQKIDQSYVILSKYAREPQLDVYECKLRKVCDEIWLNGKQQCEYLSLRGNPCILKKHDEIVDHSSGVVYISTCNCGRTQGRRDDPYNLRQANYEFYQILANNCSACNKLDKASFSVFEPSTNDYRPAYTKHNIGPGTAMDSMSEKNHTVVSSMSYASQSPLISTISQPSDTTNNILTALDDQVDLDEDLIKKNSSEEEDNSSINEIVIKIGETVENIDKHILRQPSTTEYLPGMVHTLSPSGLLPQYPSWSLMCIGSSSVYSHNTGLPEHVQSGFLSGSNYLLPWDVHVRLEHATSWTPPTYEKRGSRKKPLAPAEPNSEKVFTLKIFIGCEYECVRGHRFIMNTPDKVLRRASSNLYFIAIFIQCYNSI